MRLPLDLPPDPLTSDDWYTPPTIVDGLGLVFALDVCGPTGGVPWIPAARTIDYAEDGLSAPWSGLVWCNPPYSQPGPWMRRMADHGNGVALIPADTSTGWFEVVARSADALGFLADRTRFVRGTETTSGRFPSLLAGWGPEASAAVLAMPRCYSFPGPPQ